MVLRMVRPAGLLIQAALTNAVSLALSAGEPGGRAANALIATYGSFPDPLHWRSFYTLPRAQGAARQDGWRPASVSRPAPVRASTWCRDGDYRLCLLFDDAGSVAGLQVSVSVQDYERSFDNIHYPIMLETQWKRQTVLDTEVYSATALFVSPRVLSDGGRAALAYDDPTVPETLFLENGNGFWAMPAHAQDAGDVAFTMQGCVKGMGRHFFYDMSPDTACEELRPFFLLFDDVTGVLQGFGVTLFGMASDRGWLKRKWLEAPGTKDIEAMLPGAPICLGYYAERHGLVALHVYLTPAPWSIECAAL